MVVFMTENYVQLVHLNHGNVIVQDISSYMVQTKGKELENYM